MKAGTKINHIITSASTIARQHPDCRVLLDVKGPIDAKGLIKGAHKLTLESPNHTTVHHNASLDTMILLVQEWSKGLG